MTKRQQGRMQGVPNLVVLPTPKAKDAEPTTNETVKMVRRRDVILGGLGWSFIMLVMLSLGGDVSWNQVISPVVFALGFVFLVDSHDVEE